ncbi:HD domain-containing phosphohydrolase [uncultured Arthrobacter sp.]|uniref:HD-GYP domain-containing protein n=1 Tax=uncultured Arthrobacter sp. TaxID=114050 RepID=UPI003217EE85
MSAVASAAVSPIVLTVGVADPVQRMLQAMLSTSVDSVFLPAIANPIQAVDAVLRHCPKLVVLDLRHPQLDAVGFTRVFRGARICDGIPLLLIVPPGQRTIGYEALRLGADDFILAPPKPQEYQMRMRRLLAQTAQREVLHTRLDGNGEHAREIRTREKETLLRLAKAGEYRDENTGAHLMRLAHLSRCIAERLGRPAAECEAIELAAPLHDIGKIGIPDALLRKPDVLTPEERRIMESHTVIGYEILKGSRSIYLQMGAQIALSHHERYDGGGYPHGLRGEDIPLAARIVAVADVFDALASDRPYKESWPVAKTIAYLKEHRGTRLDPDCVDAFLSWASA